MKNIRTWVYAILKFKDKIVIVKKARWPFIGLYDLPWWKIKHLEWNKAALKREILEETWLKKKDYNIEKLFTVEEDFYKHYWKEKFKDEHMVAVIYLVNILKDEIDLDFFESWWDSNWLKLIDIDDKHTPKTHILSKVLKK